MNGLSNAARQAALEALGWPDDPYIALLVDDTYEFSAADATLADIDEGVRIGSVVLAGKTAVDGRADADDITFEGLTVGAPYGGLWIVAGAPPESLLVAWIDTTADDTPNTGTVGSSGRVSFAFSVDGLFRI